MEALPNPKTQDYRDAQLRLSYGYGAIQLSGQSFELADSNTQAFAAVLDQEMDGIKEGLRKETNRQVYGTSQGVLAIAASGSTTTFVVSSATGLQYVEIGMFVDLYNSTSTVVAPVLVTANAQITDINIATLTITLTTVGTVGAGFFLVRTGSHQKEPVGFEQIVAGLATTATALGNGAGALYNITHGTWTGNMDTTAGAISEGRMINMIDAIRTRGGRTTVGFCSLGVRRAYANLLDNNII
jgi:hypothetical protein